MMNAIDPALSIPEFYANRSIFITGGSGFMGKMLIEKLLRSCPNVREIFLFLRPKRNLNIQERLRDILNLPLFDKIREERPLSFEKVIPVNGDILAKDLGLSPEDRKMLIERVSIIFHGAAIVKFNVSLKTLILSNIRATRDICILAEEMRNLIALTYIGTAYSQTDKIIIEEILYPIDIDWRHVITIAESTIDDETLKFLTMKYIGNSPTPYTFSKRIAEQVIQDYSKVLPCTIVRPSIVVSSYKEPIAGWADSMNGIIGLHMGTVKGIVRVILFKNEEILDFIPVDVATNVTLVVTWKRGLTSLTEDPTVNVYNCAGSVNVIRNEDIGKNVIKICSEIPHTNTVWRPWIYQTTNTFLHFILNIFLNVLPAFFLDSILKLRKRAPILVTICKKTFIANIILKYYIMNSWKFRNEKLKHLANEIPLGNVESFNFKYLFKQTDLMNVTKDALIGIKKYQLNEYPIYNEAGKRHLKRICLIANITENSLLIGFIWMLYQKGIFHGIANVLTFIFYQLILGKLLTAIFFTEA